MRLAIVVLAVVGLGGSFSSAEPILSGRVLDSEGAPLAGALVSVRHQASGQARHRTTDQQGAYSVPAFGSGRYDVLASLLGFEDERVGGLEVDAADVQVPEIRLGLVVITVATRTATPIRATPGIVTLVSEEEITDSGSRDLLDVLRLVPGLDFGMDVEGAVGLAVRGNWAHEGKALLLVDGLEMPELLFSTLQFGRHFPAEVIKRIEIIRGPGSAVYGGNAELTVINVVTRGAADLEGVRATASYGQMKDAFGQRSLTLAGGRTRNDLQISGTAVLSEGNRSDRDYTDVYGSSYSLGNDDARLDVSSLNLKLGYKGLSLRFLADRYHTTMRDVFVAIAPDAVPYDFDSTFVDARYEFQLGEKVKLTPRLSYRVHRPWRATSALARQFEEELPDSYGGVVYDRRAERALGSLTGVYEPSSTLKLLAGAEAYQEQARDDLPGGTFFDGSSEISFSNVAGFAQGLLRTSVANLTLGARVDHHEQYGTEFAPRVALTRAFDKFHLKALFSRAFRAPGLENINLNPGIVPERTTVLELEAGHKLSPALTLSANLFQIRIEDPIVYGYDASDLEQPEKYLNFPRTGSRGVEIETRLRKSWGYLTGSYAHYRAYDNQVPAYQVPGQDDLLLGFSAHKLTLLGSVGLGHGLSLNPSVVINSRKFGYDRVADDEDETPLLREFPSTALVNLHLLIRPSRWGGVTLGLGVFNIFDEKNLFVQPYGDGGHGPMPDRSREVLVRLTFAHKQ